MNLLAIDSATEACSVALRLGDAATQERFENVGRAHTERLLPMVHALLADAGVSFAQLDGLVCGVGPGSFAGVRIATGFVKGIALALDRPVVGVSSLAMLALRAMDGGAQRVLAAIDARMDEVYFGAFARGADGLPANLVPELVAAPGEVPAVVVVAAGAGAGAWAAVGSGWGRYEIALRDATGASVFSCDAQALPHAADALAIALPQFAAGRVISGDALAPIYLRNKVALTLVEQAALRARQR